MKNVKNFMVKRLDKWVILWYNYNSITKEKVGDL